MSFKNDMQTDLTIFYDANEFAYLAQYKGNNISILFEEEPDFVETEGKNITIRCSEVSALETGDEITIDSQNYKIQNYDYKDKSKLEWLLTVIKK